MLLTTQVRPPLLMSFDSSKPDPAWDCSETHPAMLSQQPPMPPPASPETWRGWITSFFYADTAASPRFVSVAPDYSPGMHNGRDVGFPNTVCLPPSMAPTPVQTGGESSPPQSPPQSSSSSMRRTWSEADTVRLESLDDCPGSPSAVERLYCEQWLQNISALDDTAQMLVRELFSIITGEDDLAEPDDVTIIEHNPGYEKPTEQRSVDCTRVAAILSSGVEGVHANLTWTYGETLLWMAIEYDHQHPPQMIDVLLAAGADPNTANAVDGLVPLANPWLSDDNEMAEEDPSCAAYNALKRQRLIGAGANVKLHEQAMRDEAGGNGSRLRCADGGRKRTLSVSGDTGPFARSRSSLW